MRKRHPIKKIGKILSYGLLLLFLATLTTSGSVGSQSTSRIQDAPQEWVRDVYIRHRLALAQLREPGESFREFARLRESLSLQRLLAQARTDQTQPQIATQRSVVQIASFSLLSDGKYRESRLGSGVVIHFSGTILTNSHVIRGGGGCGISLVTGDVAPLFIILVTEAADRPPVPRFAARYVTDDQSLDVALLQIDKRIGTQLKDIHELQSVLKEKGLEALNLSPIEDLYIEPVPLWDSDVLQEGLAIVVEGFPQPVEGVIATFTSSLGEVVTELPKDAPQPVVDKEAFFHTEQVLAWSGISGGAVIDRSSGFLVGIVCGGMRLQEGFTQLARAIRINDIVKRFSAQLGQINRQPVARFTTMPFNPAPDTPVELDASPSSDINGKVVKYEWDFNGDGVFDAEGQKVSHAFLSRELKAEPSGILSDPEVHLQVTDDQGDTHSRTQRIILTRKTSCSVQLQLPGRTAQTFGSIQAAIAEAASAKDKRPATIEVSGTCQESVLIEGLKGISLKGKEKPVLFGFGDRPVLTIRGSEDITVEGLTVHGGLHGIQVTPLPQADGKVVMSSRIHILNNTIEANLERGVDLQNSREVEVTDNIIRKNGWEGLSVFVANKGTLVDATIRNNQVEENDQGGISLKGGAITQPLDSPIAQVSLVNNTVSNNKIVGISLVRLTQVNEWKNNTVTSTRADASGSFGIGIYIGGNSEAKINGGKSESNQREGMVVVNQFIAKVEPRQRQQPGETTASVTVKNLILLGNKRSGLAVKGGSRVLLQAVKAQDNSTEGVLVCDQADVSISEASISNNSGSGLRIEDISAVWLTNTVISETRLGGGIEASSWHDAFIKAIAIEVSNNFMGPWLKGNAIAEIDKSKISENGFGGIALAGSTQLTAVDTEFTSNKGFGIYATDSAKIILNQIRSQRNHGDGLFLVLQAQAKVSNSQFINNKGDGLAAQDEAQLTLIQVVTQGNSETGLVLAGNNKAEVYNSQFIANNIGLHAQSGTRLIISNVIFRDNKSFGLSLSFDSQANVSDSQFLNNNTGLYAWGRARLILRGVIFQGNSGEGGLGMLGTTRVAIYDSRFVSNKGDGLVAADNAYLALSNTVFQDNTLSGLAAFDNVQVEVNNCQFRSNWGYGISTEGGIQLSVANSIFEANRNSGINLTKETRAVIRTSSITKHLTSGVVLNGSVKAEFLENTIQGNNDCGIQGRDESIVIGRDNQIKGNHPDLCGRVPADVRVTSSPDLDEVSVPKEVATLQEAIDRLKPGGIIRLAPGIYKESITITKALTLQGPNAEHGDGKAILMSMGGIGIAVLNHVPSLDLEDLIVTGASRTGLDIAGSTKVTLTRLSLEKNRDGLVIAGEGQVKLQKTALVNNRRHGLWAQGQSYVDFVDSQIIGNDGCGVRADDRSRFTNQRGSITLNKPNLCGYAPPEILNLPEPVLELVRVPQDTESIQEAINKVKAGGRIEVAPGIYKESLTITKDLALIGMKDPREVVILNQGAIGIAILARVSQVTIEGLSIKGGKRGEIGIELLGMTQAGFTRIHVVDHQASGILVSGNAQLIFNQGVVSMNSASGLMLSGDASAEIREIWFTSNGEDGLDAEDHARFILMKAVIQDNANKGLHLQDRAQGKVQNSQFINNKSVALEVQDNAHLTLLSSRVQESGTGLLLSESAQAEVEDSLFITNHMGGLVMDSTMLALQNVSSKDNQWVGLILFDDAQANVYDSQFIDNKPYGLHALYRAKLSLSQVTFKDNTLMSLALAGDTQLQVANSEFSGSPMGIIVTENAHLNLSDTTIQGNFLCGLYVTDGAQAEVSNSQFTGNRYEGLALEGKTQLLISNSTVANNGGWGLTLEIPECYEGASVTNFFIGQIIGSRNNIHNNGARLTQLQKRQGDDTGNLCPKPARFAWPAGLAVPRILNVQFPPTITAGQPQPGEIEFADPDGGLTEVRFEIVQGDPKTIQISPGLSFDPRIRRKSHGIIPFSVTATHPQQIKLRVLLKDGGGNQSTPFEIPSEALSAPGIILLRFIKLEFLRPEDWKQSLKGTCIVHLNVSDKPSRVRVTTPDQAIREFDVPPGREVIVCGDMVSIDMRPSR